jgi:hypothetical protein
MSEKQRLKHIADREALAAVPEYFPVASSLHGAETTVDGLGAYEGGRTEIKGSNRWVAEKSRSSRTTSAKNAPGTDYATKISHRQDQDFNEIHTDANGAFWLYNVKTDAWDILGDSADIPYYEDGRGWRWGYNVKTGKWDVPVEEQEYI